VECRYGEIGRYFARAHPSYGASCYVCGFTNCFAGESAWSSTSTRSSVVRFCGLAYEANTSLTCECHSLCPNLTLFRNAFVAWTERLLFSSIVFASP
jgi:hypothetical protein